MGHRGGRAKLVSERTYAPSRSVIFSRCKADPLLLKNDDCKCQCDVVVSAAHFPLCRAIWQYEKVGLHTWFENFIEGGRMADA